MERRGNEDLIARGKGRLVARERATIGGGPFEGYKTEKNKEN